MIKAVCFDLDNTLVNSEIVIKNTFTHCFEVFFPEVKLKEEDYSRFMGPPLYKTFSEYTDNKEIVDDAIKEYQRYYKTIELGLIKIYPTVKETLEWLKKNNIKIGLITTKFLSSATPSLKHFEIYDYFDSFMCLEKQGTPKPDKDPIIRISKEIEIDPKDILMVGDNYVDIMCGKNAGSYTALVKYNRWWKEASKASPDIIVEKMEDIIKLIEKEV